MAIRADSWRQKVGRDLAQASDLLGVLAEDRPFESGEALDDAVARGRKEKAAIDRAMEGEPGIWVMLHGAGQAGGLGPAHG